MDKTELRQKLIDNDYCLKIRFKDGFRTGRFSDEQIYGVSQGEEAILTNIEYDERVFFNYPQGVTVIDILVKRRCIREPHYIYKHGSAVARSIIRTEKYFNAEIVLPEEIDFTQIFKIIEED